MPVLANRPSGADQVIKFLKEMPEGTEAVTAYIREVERPKYRPGQIITMMQAEGYRQFKMQQHPTYGRPRMREIPSSGFGSPVFGKEG